MTEPKITKTDGAFSMLCGVAVNIRAKAGRIWGLLTDAKDFPRWNSTVKKSRVGFARAKKSRCMFPAQTAPSLQVCRV